MQDPNLSQVLLCFFNVVRYGTQLFPGCNLASMIQASIFLFYSLHFGTGSADCRT
jgi:hypothetical protein